MTRLLCLFVLTLPLSRAAAAEQEMIGTIVAPATESNRRNTEGDLVVLEDGTYLLAWSDFYGGARDDSAARISAVRSTDGGRTWSPRFTLQENIGEENVMSVSFLRSKSGEILLFFLVKNSRRDLDLMVRRSADEGDTWSEPCRYPHFFDSMASWAPCTSVLSFSQPRQMVIQPGSPSERRPRKPPSLATSR